MKKIAGNIIKIQKSIFSFFREFHSISNINMKLSDSQRELVEKFNHCVLDGKIAYESVTCLCGSTNFDLLASVDRYSILQKTVLCTKCGLIQSNPRMTKEEYFRFYSSDFYRKCYDSDGYLDVYKDKYTQEEGRHIFDEISEVKKIKDGISVLEVGAGGGWNLLPFLESKAEVLGIDYSQSLVSLGRQHGINMQEGGIEKIQRMFDAIILNHVLEHLLSSLLSRL